MRAGGCTLQQALTLEAAAVVKQAVALARRRGHAQVTPLHVASTMLAAPTGLFRAACLQSHSHPLQCKALELCFNVALNRLPASSSSGPLLGPGGGYGHGHGSHHHHGHPPSLSNALVAAFKRAQAHQRRGSIESQQQPLLAVKIEVEQLIVSILDDPSVSRVMREAGFSSTQVKGNVEQALQAESTNPSGNSNPSTPNKTMPSSNKQQLDQQGSALQNQSATAITHSSVKTHQQQLYREEDVMSVVECMVGSNRFVAPKRSVVVVGECLSTVEAVVRGVMDRAEKSSTSEASLLHGVQFISLPLFSFARLSKEEVERKVAELRCFIKSCCCFPGKGGVVLYLGDLRWAAEYRASTSCVGKGGGRSSSYYCPVEHVILEIARMLSAFGNAAAAGSGAGNQIDHYSGAAGRFWVMGAATYQTYMRCKVGTPSLETLWGLHPLAVPTGSLDLSLSYDSDLQIPLRSQGKDKSNDCDNGSIHSSTSSLPSWLQKYKETKKLDATNHQHQDISSHTRDFSTNKYWTPTCTSSSQGQQHMDHHQYSPDTRTLNLSLVSSSLPSISVAYKYYQPKPTYPKTVTKEHHFWTLNPNPNTDNADGSASTTSSSETLGVATAHYCRQYKELNAENLKTLCASLVDKVPWQANVVPEIASTLLQCRSGLKRRVSRHHASATSGSASIKEDTWLLFHGCDAEGKIQVAREVAALVFGSRKRLCSISAGAAVGRLSGESGGDDDGDEDERSSKRSRTSEDHTPKARSHEMGCLRRFADAVGEDPHRLFVLEDVEQLDCIAQEDLKTAIEHGTLRDTNGRLVSLEDAVVVLICETFDARSRASSPPVNVKREQDEFHGPACLAAIDLNALANDDGNDIEVGDLVHDGGVGLLEVVDGAFFFQFRDC